jgi:hypothetical protein
VDHQRTGNVLFMKLFFRVVLKVLSSEICLLGPFLHFLYS